MFDLFGAEMPLAVRFFPGIPHRARIDRRRRLGGAPVWQRATRRRGARTPAATGGDRIRHRRRAPAAVARAPRQCRASGDDRRTDRRGQSNPTSCARYRHRASRPCRACRCRPTHYAQFHAGGRIERFLAAAAGAAGTAAADAIRDAVIDATLDAAAARTADRADSGRTNDRAAAAYGAAAAPAARGLERARRRSRCARATTGRRSRRCHRATPPAAPRLQPAEARAEPPRIPAAAQPARRARRRGSKPRRNGAASRSGVAQAESGRHTRADSAGGTLTDDEEVGRDRRSTAAPSSAAVPPRAPGRGKTGARRAQGQGRQGALRHSRTGDGQFVRPSGKQKLMTSTWGCRVRVTTVAASVAALIVSATPLAAQDISINLGQGAAGGGLNERIIQLIALLTVLSLAPSILVMMTSFTRIVVVLSLLAHGARHRDVAAELGGHLARLVPHRLRDGAGTHARL